MGLFRLRQRQLPAYLGAVRQRSKANDPASVGRITSDASSRGMSLERAPQTRQGRKASMYYSSRAEYSGRSREATSMVLLVGLGRAGLVSVEDFVLEVKEESWALG